MGDKSPKPSEEYSQSTQDIWGPQGAGLEKLYGAGQDWYQQNNPGIQNAAQNAATASQGALNAAAPAWLQGLQGGNLGGYDITGALSNSIGGAMGGPTQQQQALNTASNGGQNYTDAYRQNFVNDARTAMDTSLQSLDGRAAAAGMSGASSYGNAMARGAQDINSNLQSNLANVGYQDYNNNIQRQMQAGGAADQNLMQQQQMLQSLAGQQQGATENALGMQQQVQGYTSAEMQNLLNSSGGLQVMQGLLGDITPLTQQNSIANGGIPGSGANWNIGTSGANVSF